MRPYMNELSPLQPLSIPPLESLREVAQVRLELKELDRLCPRDWWWFRAACGLQFAFSQDGADGAIRISAEETAELEHVLAHLPFEVELSVRLPALVDEQERREGHGGWRVWRLDDAGNRFDLPSFTREPSARCYAALLEARGHKQAYFVDLEGAPPLPPPADPPSSRFVLLRQDDHGVRYVVQRGNARARLEWLADVFNREPRHKQCFFVEASP